MKRPMGRPPGTPKKVRVSYLEYKLEGPGWYWWVNKRGAIYNGPFSSESKCRESLAALSKAQFQAVVQ